MSRRAARLVGVFCEGEVSERIGQEERLNPLGSSCPCSILDTLVLDSNELSAPSSDIRSSKPLVRLRFSVMVATVRGGALYLVASALQSKCREASLAASQTCISSYG